MGERSPHRQGFDEDDVERGRRRYSRHAGGVRRSPTRRLLCRRIRLRCRHLQQGDETCAVLPRVEISALCLLDTGLSSREMFVIMLCCVQINLRLTRGFHAKL